MYPLRVGVTMSIHKLTAGSGYDYLTRQVAALDSTEKGHTGLASYYTERGETPGVWIGSGLGGIDGLTVGDPVSAEQMRALFGCGLHPLAELRQQQLQGPDLTARDYQDAARLGAPFKIGDGVVSPFRLEVAKRIAAINTAAGLPVGAPLPAADRARARTEVAREFFRAEHGRGPVDARELAGQIAKDSRPRTQTVAGYDLTFSPVKSVSTLWAVADPAVAATIERAHRAAVQDALAFIEEHALFTRTGPQGIRQVNVRGLVGTAFTHRDSRAGDPDLHTHVAVANKVQTLEGRWLSIDGRVLFKANVAASETYNTALEQHLRDTLGVRFTERLGTDPAKRPIREIVGVDRRLNQRWSTRRAHINIRRGELAIQFQDDHGRPPTPVEALHLAQQATLETRDAKHEPRSLAEQRATWLNEAAALLDGPEAVASMVQTVLAPHAETAAIADWHWVAQTADQILTVMEASRSTWQMWHVRAEAQRQVRTTGVTAERASALVDLLVDEVLDHRSVALAAPDHIEEPEVLRRLDGSSVYTVAGADLYTSQRILDAEARLVAAAGRRGGASVEQAAVNLALLEMAANGTALDAGQASLVRQMCTSGARLQLAIAPAGAGKTTAMRALALAWTQDGGAVVGLAPSAAAAAVLAEQTGIRTDTLAKLTWSLQHGDLPEWAARIGPSTLVIIDEAGMADTLSLDTAVQFVIGRGGSARLIGDDQQLAAIGAGGVLRDIKTQHGAVQLSQLHRFTNPAEACATLALREGDPKALDFYLNQGRVHVGDLATTTEDAFNAWAADRAAGLDAIMLAPTRELVAELNRRARNHRLNGDMPNAVVRLTDGNQASAGDVIITRSNDRRLRLTATDWVKNGDRWTVTGIVSNGDLTVRHNRSRLTVRLPADYVQHSAGLGYATTIHAAQGFSADTMHGLLSGQESRQQLYTMLSRGRAANHLYLKVVGDGDPHTVIRPDTVAPRTPTEILQQILARDDTPASATTLLGERRDPAARLCEAVQRYTDGVHVAAEQLVGPRIVQMLDARADQVVPYLTNEPSWPTLRAHLLTLAAETGEHPLLHLHTAAAGRELQTAADIAAVLDWRLPEPAATDPGPLPWLPGIPTVLHDHPVWGQYLAKRSQLVTDLANRIRDHTRQDETQPVWAPPGSRPNLAIIGEVAVWRAANGIHPSDPRPTGAGQLSTAPGLWQHHLDRSLALGSHDNNGHLDIPGRQSAETSRDRRHQDRQRLSRPSAVRPNSPPRASP
jgi:conjugative relaxase-like TrwC/TraI family protein